MMIAIASKRETKAANMNRKLFTILTGLMWIAIPLTALRYWQVWDALPASMATHFAADGRPNGWMSREAALYYALGVTAFILIVFTGLAVVVLKQRATLDSTSFALVVHDLTSGQETARTAQFQKPASANGRSL